MLPTPQEYFEMNPEQFPLSNVDKIQIKLLKVLSSLGASDQRASEGMYEVLYEVLRRADTGINIGYAVIYECVRTITTIYPSIQLLETAANHISRFVSSSCASDALSAASLLVT